ncbi:MAG: glycosyltransferase family 4 protein [Geobacteraceae bacterium]|nr:glycosyltransferase family 4 protein [Geobacteraceae bacterium]
MKLRLAMVTNFPCKAGVITGGVEGVASNLVTGLRQLSDMDIHIVSPSPERKSSKEVRDGLTIHWLSMPLIPAFLSYWNLYRRRVHACLQDIRPDLAHFQGVAGWSLGYKKPCVLTVHGISEKGALHAGGLSAVLKSIVFSTVEGRGRRQASEIIIINPYVRDQIGHHLRGRCRPIENPVSDDFFQVRRKTGARNILYVGRVSRLKNVDGLLRTFKKVVAHYPDARLRIAGKAESPAYLETCKRYASENGIKHAVGFLGNLDRQYLLEELSEAACLVLISRQETAPMAVEEAMAAGVPVVASRICGIPYMIDEGVDGLLVNPDDEDEIAARLGMLLGDAALNQRIGERGANKAREQFHYLNIARRTLDVYGEILNRPVKCR